MDNFVHSFAELVNFNADDLPPVGTSSAHGTTVLALKYNEGIIVIADRRATIGNLIMYDHAEKIVPLDDHTIIAISGSYARSMKVCRYLKHSFKFYRRTYLIDMSIDGKIKEISDSVALNLKRDEDNLGVFIPILGCYDPINNDFRIYFFDGAGAYFQHDSYACAGSGAERIKGIFEYLSRTKKSWNERGFNDVLTDGFRMLDIAADLDSATAGFAKIPPIAFVLDKDGNREVPKEIVMTCTKSIIQKDIRTVGTKEYKENWMI